MPSFAMAKENTENSRSNLIRTEFDFKAYYRQTVLGQHMQNIQHLQIARKMKNMSIYQKKPLNIRNINEETHKFSGHKPLERGSFALNFS